MNKQVRRINVYKPAIVIAALKIQSLRKVSMKFIMRGSHCNIVRQN